MPMSSRLGKKCYGTYESVPLFLDAVDIANVLGIPKSDVYFMFHAVDFPIITIGGRMLVRKERLFQWLELHPKISLNPRTN
jgi:hypothetical protein